MKKRIISVEVQDVPDNGVKIITRVDPEISTKDQVLYSMGKFHMLLDVDLASLNVLMLLERGFGVASEEGQGESQ